MVYPLGVPALFAYLLLVRFRDTLEKQRDKEQLAVETKKAVQHVDRLHERREQEERKSAGVAQKSLRDIVRKSASGREISKVTQKRSGRRLSDVSQVVSALQKTDLTRCSSAVSEESKEVDGADDGDGIGTSAVWGETTMVLNDLEAAYLSFLLFPYLLKCYW